MKLTVTKSFGKQVTNKYLKILIVSTDLFNVRKHMKLLIGHYY